MKTKFTILLILLLLIGGCEKEDHPIKYKYSIPSNIQVNCKIKIIKEKTWKSKIKVVYYNIIKK